MAASTAFGQPGKNGERVANLASVLLALARSRPKSTAAVDAERLSGNKARPASITGSIIDACETSSRTAHPSGRTRPADPYAWVPKMSEADTRTQKAGAWRTGSAETNVLIREHGAWPDTWEALEAQLAAGVSVDIDAQDDQIGGFTALHLAAEAGRTSALHALMAAGASLDIIGGRQLGFPVTPLMYAIYPRRHECVDALVAAGADINVSVPPTGESALATAAERGCLRTIHLLLNAGASVRTPSGVWGPLHGAVWGPTSEISCDCVVALLRAGADITAVDHVGRSPVALAIMGSQDRPPLIPTLLRKGARLPAPDETIRHYPEQHIDPKLLAYLDAVRQAGGIVRYEKMRRAPFVTALTRCFPLPSDTIPLVVEFWVRRALEY